MFSLENVGGADLCGLLDIHPSSTSLFFYMYMYHPRLISADNGSLLAFMECPKFCQDDLALIIPNYPSTLEAHGRVSVRCYETEHSTPQPRPEPIS